MGNQHAPTATEVYLSLSPGDDRTAEALDTRPYRLYLHRTRGGPVAIGDQWNEFINCGCGTTRYVVLRVESITDGDSIGDETTFVFEPHSE